MQVFDAVMIPRYLLEQVKELPWEVDDFYRQWPLYQGPLQFLYAIVDTDMIVKGVLWFNVLPMSRTLHVALISLDKAYQSQGYLTNLIIPFLKDAMAKLGIDKAIWHCTPGHVRAFERLGFSASDFVMMEGYRDAV